MESEIFFALLLSISLLRPHALIAQLVEQLPLKQTVAGSNPAGRTRKIPYPPSHFYALSDVHYCIDNSIVRMENEVEDAGFFATIRSRSLMDKMSGFEPEDRGSIPFGSTRGGGRDKEVSRPPSETKIHLPIYLMTKRMFKKIATAIALSFVSIFGMVTLVQAQAVAVDGGIDAGYGMMENFRENDSVRCLVDGQAVPCPELGGHARSFIGAGLFFTLVIVALMVWGLVFWILMIVHAVKNPIESKALWILIMLLTGILGAIVYYFAIKRPFEMEKGKNSITPPSAPVNPAQ